MVYLFISLVVGAVEWWFKNEMTLPARVMAEQPGALLDKNLE
ncbi:TetR family transcriptional regulator [Peribacillus asahii]|uniref:TetR family transcriptional regulator n=1 Tax=Peribacillus asahii TaxID=228899 RepID=A0A3T0KT37_9BACI|nr:hypothetical protein [Peribacillus asahii]AZV43433.1 TetR family transcriptional regulator [Peribacillus asahii]